MIKVELDKLLIKIRKHNILVVYKLYRLGRLLKYLLEAVNHLGENRLDCKVVIMPLTPPHRGELFLQYFNFLFRIRARFNERMSK